MPNKAIIINHNVHDVNSRFNENRLGERARWISSRTSKSAISSEPVPGSSCLPRLVNGADQLCEVPINELSPALDRVRSWIRVRSPYRSGPLHMHTVKTLIFLPGILAAGSRIIQGCFQHYNKVCTRRKLPVFLLQESVRFCHVILAAVPFFRDMNPP